MEKHHKVASSVVGLLGLLSAALSFAAEANNTPDSSYYIPASSLGFSAAVTLIVAQTIILFLTRGICCNRGFYQSNSGWTIAVICNVVSWTSFLIATLMLLISAANNSGDLWGYSAVPPGVFAGAGVLSLAAVALGIVHYLVVESEKVKIGPLVGTAAAPNRNNNIAIQITMVQPQLPPPRVPPMETKAGPALGPQSEVHLTVLEHGSAFAPIEASIY